MCRNTGAQSSAPVVAFLKGLERESIMLARRMLQQADHDNLLTQLAEQLASVPIVITGGTGFVGLALVAAALRARKAPLHVLDLHPLKRELAQQLPQHEACFAPVDLTDQAAVSALARVLPDRFALVHAASLISTRARFEP